MPSTVYHPLQRIIRTALTIYRVTIHNQFAVDREAAAGTVTRPEVETQEVRIVVQGGKSLFILVLTWSLKD